jgi:segregation and condensation protein B
MSEHFEPDAGHDFLPFVELPSDELRPLAGEDDETVWAGDDLEAAYLRALQALETVESDIAEIDDESEPALLASKLTATDRGEPEASEPEAASIQLDAMPAQEPSPESPASPPSLAGSRADVQPWQILEAVLFVGGTPLTAKKLCAVLRGDFEVAFVEAAIESLNQQYAREQRPYEIRLGEGGYRLDLRPEYERIRDKVYGAGPKEVRQSQYALEVLALVAYRQPIGREEIERLGKANAGPVLRQLLRRELIAVTREASRPKEVRYQTTGRFLSLFGLGNLDELPHADELSFK